MDTIFSNFIYAGFCDKLENRAILELELKTLELKALAFQIDLCEAKLELYNPRLRPMDYIETKMELQALYEEFYAELSNALFYFPQEVTEKITTEDLVNCFFEDTDAYPW